MRNIDMISHKVTNVSPNRVEIEVENKYVLRNAPDVTGYIVRSIVVIELDEDGRIKKVQDKQDGHLPEGTLSKVITQNRMMNYD
jgi:hypothetical protein